MEGGLQPARLFRAARAYRFALPKKQSRIDRIRETRAGEHGMRGVSIRVSGLKGALRLSERAIVDRANELDAYGLGDVSEIETDLGTRPAVRIRYLKTGWTLWLDIVQFCEKAPEPLSTLTDELNFPQA